MMMLAEFDITGKVVFVTGGGESARASLRCSRRRVPTLRLMR